MVTYRHACQGIRWKPVHGSQLFLPGRVRESRRCPCHSDNACKYLATCLQMLLAKVSENSGDLPVLVLSVIKLPEWLNRKSPVCCWRSEQTLTPPLCTKRVAPGYAITPIWYWLWNNSLKLNDGISANQIIIWKKQEHVHYIYVQYVWCERHHHPVIPNSTSILSSTSSLNLLSIFCQLAIQPILQSSLHVGKIKSR